MLRTKLLAVFSILLGLMLVMAGLLLWGTRHTDYYFQRSLYAHRELEAYMALSVDVHRHVARLADALQRGEAIGAEGLSAAERDLLGSLDRLRALTVREAEFVRGSDEAEEERAEVARVARLRELIERSLRAFEATAALQRQGRLDEARLAAARVLDGTIGEDLGGLIEAALDDERREVARADRRATALAETVTLAAAAVAALGAVLVAAAAAWLLRAIKRPIDRLMEGTRRVAAGDLAHRIRLSGRDEFARLAASFNAMAADLERQQREVIGARVHLEEEVARRTGELHRANRELRRLDRIRRRLYADISHELRTPLTVIRGEAEVTLRGGRRKTVAEYRTALQRIVALAEQLTRLVDDLLLLARSETAGVRLELRPLALGPLLAEIGEGAGVLARERGIAVSVSLGAADSVVAGDDSRLRQLFLALVDNACRYTRPGGRIAVALAADEGHAVVTVADTGVGIPPEEIDRVFDRFYRSDDARRLAPGGTGLGLSVARSIVEAHRGDIALASRRGKGTTATVRLPLTQPAAATRAHDDLAR